jgi:hypothetical protein
MNKLNQRNYVTLAVAALSAILVASIFAIGTHNAMAQNMTGGNMTTSNLTGTTGGMGSEGGGMGSEGGGMGSEGGGMGGG